MSELFKADVPDPKTPPSKDDTRARMLAFAAKESKGGSGTTALTKGMAFPALKPAGAPPKTTALTG